jgi:hypothetical protein
MEEEEERETIYAIEEVKTYMVKGRELGEHFDKHISLQLLAPRSPLLYH